MIEIIMASYLFGSIMPKIAKQYPAGPTDIGFCKHFVSKITGRNDFLDATDVVIKNRGIDLRDKDVGSEQRPVRPGDAIIEWTQGENRNPNHAAIISSITKDEKGKVWYTLSEAGGKWVEMKDPQARKSVLEHMIGGGEIPNDIWFPDGAWNGKVMKLGDAKIEHGRKIAADDPRIYGVYGGNVDYSLEIVPVEVVQPKAGMKTQNPSLPPGWEAGLDGKIRKSYTSPSSLPAGWELGPDGKLRKKKL